MNTVNFEEVAKKAEQLLNSHKEFLVSITKLDEQEYLDYIYSETTPKTKVAMIAFFRSFDDIKRDVVDVPEFNRKCGFTLEYREFMQ